MTAPANLYRPAHGGFAAFPPMKAPIAPFFSDDWEDDDMEAGWTRDEEHDRGARCGCKLCCCMDRTDHGEPCISCLNGAHQG